MTYCNLSSGALRAEATYLGIYGRSTMRANELRAAVTAAWNRFETAYPDQPSMWSPRHGQAYTEQHGVLPTPDDGTSGQPGSPERSSIVPSEPRTVFGVQYWPIDHPHAQAQLPPRPTFDEPGNAPYLPGWPAPVEGAIYRPFNVWPLPRAPRWDELNRDSWGDRVSTRDGSGAAWVPHPEGRYDRRYRFAVRIGDRMESYMRSRPMGPSVRDCRSRSCVGRDGCAYCNEDVYRICYDGCADDVRFRAPVSGPCNCWVECPECNESMPPRSMTCVGELGLCTDCRDEYYSTCQGCGDWYRTEWGHTCPYRCTCDACSGTGARPGRIEYYSYKPEPLFLGEGPLYLGVEIEMSTYGADMRRQAIAGHVQTRLGDIGYLKSDSSISDGFEIVTHPMSLDFAMDHFPWPMFDEVLDMGVREHSSCGIHVHASRDGFSGPTHTYRWLKFIHRNQRQIEQFARRRSDQWAPFRSNHRQWAVHLAKAGVNASDEMSTYAEPPTYHGFRTQEGRKQWWVSDAKVNAHGHPCSAANERYAAVNVTNEHTLEVRLFAGSVTPDEIKGVIQFVHATIEYTRQLDAHTIAAKQGWTWDAFANWARKSPRYTILVSEIERLVH